jgi:ferritin
MIKPNKLKPVVVSMLNERIGDEYLAHYHYTCAANYCQNVGFFKAAKFFFAEAAAELDHANGIMAYLNQWNIQPAIPKVETNHKFSGLVEIIEKSYKLEYDLFEKNAENSKKILVQDINTFDFLQKYRTIQTESVAEFSDFLNALELIDPSDKFQLFMFEKEHFEG